MLRLILTTIKKCRGKEINETTLKRVIKFKRLVKEVPCFICVICYRCLHKTSIKKLTRRFLISYLQNGCKRYQEHSSLKLVLITGIYLKKYYMPKGQ